MNPRRQDQFLYSVAVLLFITAVAKLYSATGTARALDYPDALLPLTNRHVFNLVGALELGLSAFLLMKSGQQSLKLWLLLWLAVNFLVYRAGLWSQGSPALCDCLGNLNEKLPLSPRLINAVMLVVLAWFGAGSALLLGLDYFSRRRSAQPQALTRDPVPA